MTTTLLLFATALGLVLLAFWWFGPIMASVTADLAAQETPRRPVPPGLADPECGIGAALMAAPATSSASKATTKAGGKAPKRKKPTGPSRRAFLRYSLFAGLGASLASLGAASLGFIWPVAGKGGFGSVIELGTKDDVLAEISAGNGTYAYTSGKLYMVTYDASQDPDGVYSEVVGDGVGLMALYQKCVHLGCRVPWCESSQWFECPCHGSQYNRWGEFQAGPAPRNLDRFPVTEQDGVIFVDTSTIVEYPKTIQKLSQPPAGGHC